MTLDIGATDEVPPSHSETRRGARSGTGAPVRVLLLYGSMRQGSLSRALVLEAQRALDDLGAATRVFEPGGLPLEIPPEGCAKLSELRDWIAWSDAQVWCSPVHHASLSGVMKHLIDCFPETGLVGRGRQGKVLGLMQVSGGRMCCNALDDMQRAGRSLGFYVALKQVSAADAHRAFGGNGRPLEASLIARVRDAMTEVVDLAWLHKRVGSRLHRPRTRAAFSAPQTPSR